MRPRPAQGDQRQPHRGAKHQRLSLAGAAAAKHSVAVSVGQAASASWQGFESAGALIKDGMAASASRQGFDSVGEHIRHGQAASASRQDIRMVCRENSASTLPHRRPRMFTLTKRFY